MLFDFIRLILAKYVEKKKLLEQDCKTISPMKGKLIEWRAMHASLSFFITFLRWLSVVWEHSVRLLMRISLRTCTCACVRVPLCVLFLRLAFRLCTCVVDHFVVETHARHKEYASLSYTRPGKHKENLCTIVETYRVHCLRDRFFYH